MKQSKRKLLLEFLDKDDIFICPMATPSMRYFIEILESQEKALISTVGIPNTYLNDGK